MKASRLLGGRQIPKLRTRNAKPPPALETYRPGGRVTLQEIQDVLAHGGYSADKREAWLKELLTDVTQEQSKTPSPAKEKLIAAIKAIIDANQKGKAIADDVL